ncbi:hypothetical protein AB0910_10365 [Streptomyces sp. NPDC047002]|uniref:hypothetical protein n=1 Tax=Streptomyces sp. NPDC047002 TaxID=3155475 RepID=UPI0034542502
MAAFWRAAAEGSNISDDGAGVARLLKRDPCALLAAAEERFASLGGRRGDALVPDRNGLAHHARRAAGYAPEPQWTRRVKPLTG